EFGLRPRQRRVLQPVEHLRRQLIQAGQLLGQHRHQDQQQRQQDQGEQGKHRDHTQGPRQSGLFQAIRQRVAHVRQQQRYQKRRQNRVQQVNKQEQQDNPAEPKPAPCISHQSPSAS